MLPQLSICCLTREPPERVAAVLAPLRDLADEVVLAVDAEVPASQLPHYAALADRLHRVRYHQFEGHLEWLFGQCRGEWILQLDGDEVPSAALMRRLPELLTRTDARQVRIRRAWLWPDAGHVLDQAPWTEDYNIRLLRNDGMIRTSGQMHAHAEPLLPAVYVDEPLLHLNLILEPERSRRDKAVIYEARNPQVWAASAGRFNETFYLPERQDPGPAVRPIAAEDASAVVRSLSAGAPPAQPAGREPCPWPVLEDTMAHPPGGPLADDAYRVRIEGVDRLGTLRAGQTQQVHLTFVNEGTACWPWGMDTEPLIRPAYRWVNDDGTMTDGLRSPFTHDVRPGDAAVAPFSVEAPAAPGRYTLEIDLVHEGVRWFACGVRRGVTVAAPDPPAVRLRPSDPAHGALRIPRTLHRVWLGGAAVPEEFERYWQHLGALHPDWELRTWGDADLESLGVTALDAARARHASELSDLLRYEILHRHGGVYLDADVEGRRPLDDLLGGIDAFAALEVPERTGTAVLGAVPGHPVFARMAALVRRNLGLGIDYPAATGPYLLTLVLEDEPGVHIFDAGPFYPYLWDEPDRHDEAFPDAFLVHRWAMSWA